MVKTKGGSNFSNIDNRFPLLLTIKELNTIEKMDNNRKRPNLGYFWDIFFLMDKDR